mmetsp:Transcript_1181/g.2448  ORF Transcript_1181/g.2448 Transcript_1181/m.2448 type:complete len:446 (+) Transcript_1181:65-1402(+)
MSVLPLESSFLARIIMAKASGVLSMIGSGLIIRDVIFRWKRRKHKDESLPTVSRVILSMSLLDFGNSFIVHFVGTWMVPDGIIDDSFPIPLTAGNEMTCTAQAFFSSLFSMAGCSSNATLAFAYWFTVCKGKKERDLKKWKWQIALVYSPWIIGFADSLVGIGFEFHHYNRLWFCDTLSDHYSPHKWRPKSVAALLGVVNVLIIGVMVSLIRFVYTVEKKTDTHRSDGERRQRTIEVTQQGIWFIVAYMAAWLPAIIGLALLRKSPPSYVVFIACMYPLQGFFNALVYFRPKYISQRQQMVPGSTERASRLTSMINTLHLPRASSRNLLILSRVPSSARDLAPVGEDQTEGAGREGDDVEEGTKASESNKSLPRMSSKTLLLALSRKPSAQESCRNTILVETEYNNESDGRGSGGNSSNLRRNRDSPKQSGSKLVVMLPMIEENC